MKTINKVLAVLSGILLMHSPVASAAKCAEVKGNMVVGKVTLGCTYVTGSATLTKTTMTGKLTLQGDLRATESTFAALDVVGDVTLNNATVAKVAKIQGGLMANNTTFADKLELTTQKVDLNRVTTQGIKIKSSKMDAPVYVTLNESTVAGDITFVDGNGVVKSHHATITGKVVGGKVE